MYAQAKFPGFSYGVRFPGRNNFSGPFFGKQQKLAILVPHHLICHTLNAHLWEKEIRKPDAEKSVGVALA